MTYYYDMSPYYMDNDFDILKRINENYQQSISLQQGYWTQANYDLRFRAGDQTLWNEVYSALPAYRRRQFNFNRIRRVVSMISGYQRKNRKTSVVVPVENSSQETADQLTKTLFWARNRNNFYHTFSDACENAVTTGISLLSYWVNYMHDPESGDVECDNMGYDAFMIDPLFRKRDISDANFVMTRKWFTKKQISMLLPGREKEIMDMDYQQNRDQKFMYMPENYQFSLLKLLPYDEYWYLDSREAKIIIDTETGETVEFDSPDEEILKMYLREFPQSMVVKKQVPTCKLAVVVNGRVMYNGPNPLKTDRYPFVPVLCYFEPDITSYSMKLQGVVRGLRDAQYLYNRRKVIELDIMESQINSGIIYKEDALIDPNDAFLSGQGRALALKKTATMDDVRFKDAPQVPPSMIELSEILGREIQEIAGINDELLGMADDGKAGILAMLRQGAGLTTLQGIFDGFDLSLKLATEIELEIIEKNFTKGKIARIIGEEPSLEIQNRAYQKYECVVQEGMLTTTQKQMQFAQLMELRSLGIPIPDSVLIDSAQIQNKQDLIDAIESQQEAVQQQSEAQAQMQMQEQQILNNSLSSKAESDRALAAERLAKIQYEQAANIEKIAKSKEDLSQATLAKVKALKELEEMDISNIERLLAIYRSLKSAEISSNSQENVVL